MSAKWSWTAATAILTVLGFVQYSHDVNAGGTPTCSLAFGDRDGDRITSDGHGAYADDGKGQGVNCGVGGSNNIVLTLGARTNRRFRGDYSGLVPGSAFVTDPPTGTFDDGFLVNVQHVANMSVGTTMVTQAHFGRPNSVYMHWCGGASASGPLCTYSGNSMAVAVTRTAKRTWLVTTDPPAGYESVVGDRALLADNTGAAPIALYHMPFQFTVDCAKCP